MALPNYGMLSDIFKTSARGAQTIEYWKPVCLRIGSSAYKMTSQQPPLKPSYGFGVALADGASRSLMFEELSNPLVAKLYNTLLSLTSTTMLFWERCLEPVFRRWLTNLGCGKISHCSSVMTLCTFVL